MQPALAIEDLRVAYRSRRATAEALRGVSVHAGAGEILGILGPNAAGKTSLLEVCEGFRPASGGTARVLGFDPGDRRELRELRKHVGVVLQSSSIEPQLTVSEVLRRNARYYPKPRRVSETLRMTGLSEAADAYVGKLSGGQQRRVDLALGLIGRPGLLFLDEPTVGLDPPARRQTWQTLRELAEAGTTIVLTTHYLEEAEHLCDRIAVLVAGLVRAQGSPSQLVAAGGGSAIGGELSFTFDGDARPPVLHTDELVLERGRAIIRTPDLTRALHSLSGWALQRSQRLEGLQVRRSTLEDVYLELVSGKGDA